MQLEAFIEQTNKAGTPEEVFSLFVQAIRDLGFDQCLFSLLTHHHSIGQEAQHGIAYNYPTDWVSYYLQKGYQRIDPVCQQINYIPRAFVWSRLQGLNATEQRVMDEAQEAGLVDGVGIPIHSINNEVAGFGVASSGGKIEASKNLLSTLELLARQFYIAYIPMLRPDPHAERIILSPREREILLRFSQGHSISTVADMLHMTIEELRQHNQAIYQKLGVTQRSPAILKAIRYGLIHPYGIEA